MTTTVDLGGRRVLVADAHDGPIDARRAKDLIAEAHAAGADWLALATTALPPAFFDLRSGVAGDILQAGVTYRMPLAIVGELPEPAATSGSFVALVRESNRGRAHWFVAHLDDLGSRLAGRPG